jgi:nucleoside permease NupC
MAPERFISLLGLLVLIGLAWLCSAHRDRINWRTVAWGTGLQVLFALLILKTGPGRWIFARLNEAVTLLLSFQDEGAKFVFGSLGIPAGQPGSLGFFFAFQVLTTIIFFSSLISMLYYIGFMQGVVRAFAWVMVRTCGTSGAESLSASANIFVGQTEAPLLIKPYVAGMTRSEALRLKPITRRAAPGGFRRDARLGVIKPMLVRLLVGRAENRILNRLNGNGFVWHGYCTSTTCRMRSQRCPSSGQS